MEETLRVDNDGEAVPEYCAVFAVFNGSAGTNNRYRESCRPKYCSKVHSLIRCSIFSKGAFGECEPIYAEKQAFA